MFLDLIHILILATTVGLSALLLMLAMECLAALLPDRPLSPRSLPTGRVDVLIPAHNESAGIAATLASVQSQLPQPGRVWVVADNCSDDTASIALAHGARVLERFDLDRRGKSFALEFGLKRIAADPPEVLILIDADCCCEPGAIRELASAVLASGQPVQASYLMHPPQHSSPRDLISNCAVTIKNLVRPLGLSRLGLACPLTGSGIGFPWKILSSIELANGSIVEDMQLGIDLVLAGYRPVFCRQAHVTAMLPAESSLATGQRRRWEHGHLHVILTQVPRLLAATLRQRRISLLLAALDVAIPPLSLLAFVASGVWIAALALGLSQNHWFPLSLISGCGILALAAGTISWRRYAADRAGWTTLLAAPHYMVRKVPLYLSFMVGRERNWVRTAREPPLGGGE